MTPAYLDLLDELLQAGAAHLSDSFCRLQVRFVESLQQPDGGFRGRRGPSDPYYTDFALRVLVLLSPRGEAIQAAAGYLRAALPPADVVQAFSLLNSARLLRQARVELDLPPDPLTAALAAQRLPSGGYARRGGSEISAYNTFIAALCHALLNTEFPAPAECCRALMALQGAGGGFRESPGGQGEQTSATAAATAALNLLGGLTQATSGNAVAFLSSLQAPDGGLRAHPQAAGGDLLSTFTGLLTLIGLGDLGAVAPAGIARFLRTAAVPSGGFRAHAADTEPDAEYTWYGLACLALLRGMSAPP